MCDPDAGFLATKNCGCIREAVLWLMMKHPG